MNTISAKENEDLLYRIKTRVVSPSGLILIYLNGLKMRLSEKDRGIRQL